MPDDVTALLVADDSGWWDWLETNHEASAGEWLILAKKGTTAPTSLVYALALEAALCFGWIDGQRRSRDEVTFLQRFTPRRSTSIWSARNVDIVGDLVRRGRMQPAGQAEIDRARADGRWDAAYAGQASMDVPADLANALAARPSALAMFGILTSQNRYAVLFRVHGAKTEATRARRIAGFVDMLARGETVYPQKRTLEQG